jgi:uncharacterized protein YuzE
VKQITFTYDPQADAVHIRLSRKAWAYAEQVDEQRNVDYAADGTPIGIELLYVGDGMRARGLPQEEVVTCVIEAVQCLRRAPTSSFTRVTIAA